MYMIQNPSLYFSEKFKGNPTNQL